MGYDGLDMGHELTRVDVTVEKEVGANSRWTFGKLAIPREPNDLISISELPLLTSIQSEWLSRFNSYVAVGRRAIRLTKEKSLATLINWFVLGSRRVPVLS